MDNRYMVIEIAEGLERVYVDTSQEWIAHRKFIDDVSFWKNHEHLNRSVPKRYRTPYAIEEFDFERDPNANTPIARYPMLRIEMRRYEDEETYTVLRSADGPIENEPGKSFYEGTQCWTSAWQNT